MVPVALLSRFPGQKSQSKGNEQTDYQPADAIGQKLFCVVTAIIISTISREGKVEQVKQKSRGGELNEQLPAFMDTDPETVDMFSKNSCLENPANKHTFEQTADHQALFGNKMIGDIQDIKATPGGEYYTAQKSQNTDGCRDLAPRPVEFIGYRTGKSLDQGYP
jgi:hypothetical protein